MSIATIPVDASEVGIIPADFEAYIAWTQSHHGLSADEAGTLREDIGNALTDDDYTVAWKESEAFKEWAKKDVETSASVVEAHTAETVNAIVELYADAIADAGKRNLAIGFKVLDGLKYRVAHFPAHSDDDFNAYLSRLRDAIRVRITIEKTSIRLKLWVESAILHTAIVEAFGEECAARISFFELGKVCPLAVKLTKSTVSAEVSERWLDFVHSLATDRLAGVPVSSSAFTERLDAHTALLVQEGLNALSQEDRERVVREKSQADRKAEVRKVTDRAEDAIREALKTGIVPALTLSRMVEEHAKDNKREFPRWDSFSKDDMIALTTRLLEMGKMDLLRMMRDRSAMMVRKMDELTLARQAIIADTTPADTLPLAPTG